MRSEPFKPFVWRNRLVKIEDGCMMWSRVGDHNDFDFCPDKPDNDMPFAVGFVLNAKIGPNNSLAIQLSGQFEHDRVCDRSFQMSLVKAPESDSDAL